MPDLGLGAWALLALAAVVVGVSKSALPGASTLSVAVFAGVLPAKQSTATLLVLLIVGDVFALSAYRRHADWRTLLRLAPAIVVGLVVGAVFLAFASDAWVRRVIAVILLVLVAVSLWLRRREHVHRGGRVAAATYGTLGGFTTMVANAGGPVMSMYFVAARFEVLAFLGTAAWLFACVNITKVPIAIGLGLLTWHTLLIDLVLAPAVLVGAFGGRMLARRMNQMVFERVVIVLTVAGALYLLV